MKILYLEDDKDLNAVMTILLEGEGYIVDSFHSAIKALKKYKSGKYFVILSDNFMPEMTGLEFVKEIRKIDPGVPSIILTAGRISLPPSELKQLGIIKVFEKPFDVHEMLSFIEDLKKD